MPSIKTVFITGATGFVGTKVTEELIKHGYQVTGLARSQESADKLTKAGAKHVNGTLTDLDILAKTAADHDATIHLGFIHDFSNFPDSVAKDRAAVETIVKALEGTNKTFIGTGGTLANHPPLSLAPDATSRTGTAKLALSYADKGVRSINVKLPPSVHGAGDKGFVPFLITIATSKGASKYPKDGSNVWPAIHRDDAAVLYRLILEKAQSGSNIDAIGEASVPTKLIAQAIGKRYNLPVESASESEISEAFGFLGTFFSIDGPEDPSKAQSFGWKPVSIGLVEDIEKNY